MATAKNGAKPKFGSPEWRAMYLGKGKGKGGKGGKEEGAGDNPKSPEETLDKRRKTSKKAAKKSGKKNWIAAAIGKKGALHAALGIPQGQKIPLATLQAAAKRKDKVGKEARLALTLRGLNHSGKAPAKRKVTKVL